MHLHLLNGWLAFFPLGSLADLGIVGSWWTSFYSGLSHMISTQRGMVQFGFLGMIFALIIIWWRK